MSVVKSFSEEVCIVDCGIGKGVSVPATEAVAVIGLLH